MVTEWVSREALMQVGIKGMEKVNVVLDMVVAFVRKSTSCPLCIYVASRFLIICLIYKQCCKKSKVEML